MKDILKKHWNGKYSLGQSYWIGGVLIPVGLALPLLIMGASALYESESGAIFIIVYWVFLFVANMFLMIGVFNSASNYIKINKKKKKGTFWGRLAQITVVIGIITVIGQYLVVLSS